MTTSTTASGESATTFAQPLVSIALATYNGERYLEELLSSIEAQDYPSIEVVVSDDQSTDGTRRLLAERAWRRPWRLVESTDRAGVIGNFSRALAACGGAYIALADQDDHWMPGKISTLVECVAQREGADRQVPTLAFSDIEVVDAQLRPLAPSFFALDGKSTDCDALQDFLVANHVPGCSMLFNRALLDRASPIPQAFHMHDWWLILTAAAFGRVAYVDRPLLQYRQHGTNVFGAIAERSSFWVKASKAWSLAAWRTYLLPSDARVASTVRNVQCFEERFATRLPASSGTQLAAFHRAGSSIPAALRYCRLARTGESWLFSVALLRAVARARRPSIVAGADPTTPINATRRESH